MTKLLLISCRSNFLDDDRVYPPLGIFYLKSYINKEMPNVEVDLIDEYNLTHPEIFSSYDYIGISIMTPQKATALKILHTIKEHYPEKKVIAGGTHPTYYLDDISKEPYDYIVVGDGEKSLIAILQGCQDRILNIQLSKEEISHAPRPDRTSENAKSLLNHYHYFLGNKKTTAMMTARGCPFQCTFCEAAGTELRLHNLGTILEELNDIVNLGFEAVYIFDDTFCISMSRMIQICNMLKERSLIYRCNGHPKLMTTEMAKLLSETGCYEIAVGIESGSQKILDNINKRTTVKQNYDFVSICKEYGMIVKAFMLIGLPGETGETLLETEHFIATSGIDDFQLAALTIYRGTRIRQALDNCEDIDIQLLVSEVNGAYGIKNKETTYEVRTKELSSEQLRKFRDYIMNKYGRK